MTRQSYDRAHQQGREAFLEGLTVNDNPYDEDTSQEQAWLDGWFLQSEADQPYPDDYEADCEAQEAIAFEERAYGRRNDQ